jgi:hypothetical protein
MLRLSTQNREPFKIQIKPNKSPELYGLGWIYLDAIFYFSFHILTPRKTLQYQAAANLFLEILLGDFRVFGFQPVHHHSNFRFLKESPHIFRFFVLPATGTFTVRPPVLFNSTLVNHYCRANAATKKSCGQRP